MKFTPLQLWHRKQNLLKGNINICLTTHMFHSWPSFSPRCPRANPRKSGKFTIFTVPIPTLSYHTFVARLCAIRD